MSREGEGFKKLVWGRAPSPVQAERSSAAAGGRRNAEFAPITRQRANVCGRPCPPPKLLFFPCNYALSRYFFHHGASAARSARIPAPAKRCPARTCRDQSVFGEPVRPR